MMHQPWAYSTMIDEFHGKAAAFAIENPDQTGRRPTVSAHRPFDEGVRASSLLRGPGRIVFGIFRYLRQCRGSVRRNQTGLCRRMRLFQYRI